MLHRKLLLTVALFAGCASNPGSVNVQVLPTEYVVGSVRSELATPGVDEVVRLKPKVVHFSICMSMPPAKVIQFQTELRARLDARMTAGYYEKCPEKSVASTPPAVQKFIFRPDGMLTPLPPSDSVWH
ncbi:hypothetical protein LJR129_004924 [Acidovorax sp. LjRoot129]|uniref:hypothetical protein n=1 Tax=unclassified Acidovorax TaxID=2684926 RepID=UPI003ECC3E64